MTVNYMMNSYIQIQIKTNHKNAYVKKDILERKKEVIHTVKSNVLVITKLLINVTYVFVNQAMYQTIKTTVS